MIDLKTLYEQTTLYCELVETIHHPAYKIEIFHQPDTPLFVFAYWNYDTNTLHSIAYQTKGEN